MAPEREARRVNWMCDWCERLEECRAAVRVKMAVLCESLGDEGDV